MDSKSNSNDGGKSWDKIFMYNQGNVSPETQLQVVDGYPNSDYFYRTDNPSFVGSPNYTGGMSLIKTLQVSGYLLFNTSSLDSSGSVDIEHTTYGYGTYTSSSFSFRLNLQIYTPT